MAKMTAAAESEFQTKMSNLKASIRKDAQKIKIQSNPEDVLDKFLKSAETLTNSNVTDNYNMFEVMVQTKYGVESPVYRAFMERHEMEKELVQELDKNISRKKTKTSNPLEIYRQQNLVLKQFDFFEQSYRKAIDNLPNAKRWDPKPDELAAFQFYFEKIFLNTLCRSVAITLVQNKRAQVLQDFFTMDFVRLFEPKQLEQPGYLNKYQKAASKPAAQEEDEDEDDDMDE